MSDNMSQEEIDKLLKGVNAGDNSADDAQIKSLTSEQVDTIGEIANMTMGTAATTLSMLLNQKVDITTPRVKEFKNLTEIINTKEECVTVEIKYEEGLDNLSVFKLKTIDAAIIADLMMGGDGNVAEGAEVSELQLSAVSEAMNQMMGSSSTSLAQMFNFPINISPPVVNLQKKGGDLVLQEDVLGAPVVAVCFDFKIGDLVSSEMIELLSFDSVRKQVELLTEVTQAASRKYEEEKQHARVETKTEVASASSSSSQPANDAAPVTVQPVQFSSFDSTTMVKGENNKNLDILMDIKLKLTVELGRTELPIKKVLDLTRGSIIELDKIAGEPVELFANGKLIAQGEVVVIEDNFGLRITNIINPEDRIKEL